MLSRLHVASTLEDYELLIMLRKSWENKVNPTRAENLARKRPLCWLNSRNIMLMPWIIRRVVALDLHSIVCFLVVLSQYEHTLCIRKANLFKCVYINAYFFFSDNQHVMWFISDNIFVIHCVTIFSHICLYWMHCYERGARWLRGAEWPRWKWPVVFLRGYYKHCIKGCQGIADDLAQGIQVFSISRGLVASKCSNTNAKIVSCIK